MLWLAFFMVTNVCLATGIYLPGNKPHICFILVDDLGWNDVSFHGSREIPTPNIDVLAANSIVLNNYYVQPLCTPSRAALMTGRHPIEYGLQHSVLIGFEPAGLSLNYTLLPEHLKRLGYATHGIGKWHLGFFHEKYTPQQRGFDSYFGYWTGAIDYYQHDFFITASPNSTIKYGWGKALRRNMDYADNYRGQYATHLFTDEAINIIQNHDVSKPLFLFLSHLAVHSANCYDLFQAPDFYLDQVQHISDINRRKFAGMTLALDKSIGEVFAALEEKGILENTIFIISTDNGGEAAGLRGGVGSNWPLRGNKGNTFEAGIRGVGLIWSRLFDKTRRISNQLMHISDWLPTLYKAAGGDLKDLGNIYGQDLWYSLSFDKPSPRTELLHNIDPVDNVKTLRDGKYKLMMGSNKNARYDSWYGPTGRRSGISTSEYQERLQNAEITNVLKRKGWYHPVKYSWLSKFDLQWKCRDKMQGGECVPTDRPCLFNVIVDPCERDNIADKNPEIVKKMMKRLDEYNAMAVPLVNRTEDPRSDPALYGHHWTNWADYPSNYFEV